jgi:hypothetical protein
MYLKRYLALLVAAAAILAATWVPAAQADTPAPGYEAFAGCPNPVTENPEVFGCFTSTISGGHFQMGSKDVPITKPMTLSGGITESQTLVYNSKGGLSKVKQQVPGGVIGLTGLDWLVNYLSVEALQLYAVTEIAGTPSNPLVDPVTLPIKVHLINPVLGNHCYVGSDSNPITLHLTYRTTSPPPPNQPITGQEPTVQLQQEPFMLLIHDGTLVDNSFAAPGANGCVLTLLGIIPVSINGLVNSQSGLPAAAGTNETVQEIDGASAPPSRVYP